MSAIGLISLTQALSNQSNTASPEAQTAPRTAAHGNQATETLGQDQFTPSNQSSQQATAQAAGLFNVAQTPIFSQAANQLLQQPNPAPTANANQQGGATTSLVVTQQQLQALNLALAVLGLSEQDIAQLDQIANTVNNYNPQAYTTRALQLEVLAKREPAQTPAQATRTAKPTAADTNAAVAKATSATTAGGTTANR